MKKIILYISMTLDGFIARKNGDTGFLQTNFKPLGEDRGLAAFSENIDIIFMGRHTFEQVVHVLSPAIWPYGAMKTYVFTHHPLALKKQYPSIHENIFFTDDSIEKIVNLVQKDDQLTKDIWLYGGPGLIHPFIEKNIIDVYQITILPYILGAGIPLFWDKDPTLPLSLHVVKAHGDLVEITYFR